MNALPLPFRSMSDRLSNALGAIGQSVFGEPSATDQDLLRQHLCATAQRYAVVGLVTVAATPLIYTLARIAAPKRRATLVDLSTRVEEQWEEEGGKGGQERQQHKSGPTTPRPAAGRSPQRADPRTGRTKVGSVTVSYSGGNGGGGGREPRMYELARRYSTYLLPISRSVLSNQRASDPAFGHAFAVPTSIAFFSNITRHLTRRLIVDLVVHVAMFGLCAFVDARIKSTGSAGQGSGRPASKATAAGVEHGSAGEGKSSSVDTPSSAVVAVVSSAWAYGRWLLVDLFYQGLFRETPMTTVGTGGGGSAEGDAGRVSPQLSVYQLYDFAFSVATPVQQCCMPRWAVRVVQFSGQLLWLGRPFNAEWAAAERTSSFADGGAVTCVWRSMTPKGYFVYFLLREMSQHTVRYLAVMGLHHARYGCRCVVALGRGSGWPQPRCSPGSPGTESSVQPTGRHVSGTASIAVDNAACDRASGRQHRQPPPLVRAARHVLSPHLVTCCLRDLSYAATRYVLVSTLTLVDGLLDAEKQVNSGLLCFLRSGRGLCFHALGYLTGVHVLFATRAPTWAAVGVSA